VFTAADGATTCQLRRSMGCTTPSISWCGQAVLASAARSAMLVLLRRMPERRKIRVRRKSSQLTSH
jgi:hypothetical protein